MSYVKLSVILLFVAATLAPVQAVQAKGADGSAGPMWNGSHRSMHRRKHVRMSRSRGMTSTTARGQ